MAPPFNFVMDCRLPPKDQFELPKYDEHLLPGMVQMWRRKGKGMWEGVGERESGRVARKRRRSEIGGEVE